VVIDFDNYEPVVRGRDADAFIKWLSPLLVPDDQPAGTNDYMVGYVWPDEKTVFPDFLKPETQDWWAGELKLLHDVSKILLCCLMSIEFNHQRTFVVQHDTMKKVMMSRNFGTI
jgi:hypothetical protein